MTWLPSAPSPVGPVLISCPGGGHHCAGPCRGCGCHRQLRKLSSSGSLPHLLLRRTRSVTTGIQVHLGIGSEGGGRTPPSLAGRSLELLIRPWAGPGSAGCGAPAKPCLHTLPPVQAEPSGPPLPSGLSCPPHFTVQSQPLWGHWLFPHLPTGHPVPLSVVLKPPPSWFWGAPRSWSSALKHLMAFHWGPSPGFSMWLTGSLGGRS